MGDWDGKDAVRCIHLNCALAESKSLGTWQGVARFLHHPRLRFAFGVVDDRAYLAVKYELTVEDVTGKGNAAGLGTVPLARTAATLPLRMLVQYCIAKGVRSLIFTGHSVGGTIAQLSCTFVYGMFGLEIASESLNVRCITFGAPPMLYNAGVCSSEAAVVDFCSSILLNFCMKDDVVPSLLSGLPSLATAHSPEHCSIERILRDILRFLQSTGANVRDKKLTSPDPPKKAADSGAIGLFQEYATGFWTQFLEKNTSRLTRTDSDRCEKREVREALSSLKVADAPTHMGKKVVLCTERPPKDKVVESAADVSSHDLERHSLSSHAEAVLSIHGDPGVSEGLSDAEHALEGLECSVDYVSVTVNMQEMLATITLHGINMELVYSLRVFGISSAKLAGVPAIELTRAQPESVTFEVSVKDQKTLKAGFGSGCYLEDIRFFGGRETKRPMQIPVPAKDVTWITEDDVQPGEAISFGVMDTALLEMAYVNVFKKATNLTMDAQRRRQYILDSNILKTFELLERELLQNEYSCIVDAVDRFALDSKAVVEVREAHSRVKEAIEAIILEISRPLFLPTKVGKACGMIGASIVATALVSVSPAALAFRLAWICSSTMIAGAANMSGNPPLNIAASKAIGWVRGKSEYIAILKTVYNLMAKDKACPPEDTEIGYEDAIDSIVSRLESDTKAILQREGKVCSNLSIADERNPSKVLEMVESASGMAFQRLAQDAKLASIRMLQVVLNIRRLRQDLISDFKNLDGSAAEGQTPQTISHFSVLPSSPSPSRSSPSLTACIASPVCTNTLDQLESCSARRINPDCNSD